MEMPRVLAKITSGVSWVFILASWLAMVFLLVLSFPTVERGFQADVFRVHSNEGPDVTGWGLTYRGQRGLVMLTCQIVLVASFAVAARTRAPVMRRIGLTGIAVWAALWACGFVRLTAATGSAEGATAFACLAFLCTVAEMVRQWSPHLPPPSAK
jgi:hypothetical protein